MKDWSFQLYSARDFSPLKENLRLLAEIGYSQVEGYGGLYNDIEKLRSMLNEYGLTMPTGHFDMELLRGTGEGYRIAEKLGMEVIICPYILENERPRDTDGWKLFSETLTKTGDLCRQAGFGFAWHNHDFEFEPLPDGQIPMKILLDHSDMDWEIDLAWVVKGNSNPLGWISEYGNRFCAVHLKDIAPHGENADEDGWADLGHGIIDWPKMFQRLVKTPASWFILEHDKPNNLDRFARRSMETVRTFGVNP